MKQIIVLSNDSIIEILNKPNWNKYKFDDWGIVNPQTSRILSRPVETYMYPMMEHPHVKKQLDQILN